MHAFVGGVNGDGALSLFLVKIEYDEATRTVLPPTSESVSCPQLYCAIGETDIAEEFIGLKSERAKKEAQEWKPPKNSKPQDYDILKTMRLVELTIKYGSALVGGPIDAVELDKDGSLRWFANEKNCLTN
jgi:hypothetical protein